MTTLKCEELREISQLLSTAKHYLKLANILSRKKHFNGTQTLKQLGNSHKGSLTTEELCMAHLSSSAIRLCTIQEKNRATCYRGKYYIKKGKQRRDEWTEKKVFSDIKSHLCEHIHFLLRDSVAHEENKERIMATDRQEILCQLTVDEILQAMNDSLKNFK